MVQALTSKLVQLCDVAAGAGKGQEEARDVAVCCNEGPASSSGRLRQLWTVACDLSSIKQAAWHDDSGPHQLPYGNPQLLEQSD